MTNTRSYIRGGVVALTLATLAGCGSGADSSAMHSSSHTGTAAATVKSAAVRVSISGFSFHAATVTVAPGARVTFSNHDQTAHTATSTQPPFDTGTIAPGKSATVILHTPGKYTYICQFHAFMHGTVVVT